MIPKPQYFDETSKHKLRGFCSPIEGPGNQNFEDRRISLICHKKQAV